MRANLPRMANGELDEYAWPGGYPLFYVVKDPTDLYSAYVVCPKCAKQVEADAESVERVVAGHVNWEDEDLYCENCGAQIECAYPSDKEAV